MEKTKNIWNLLGRFIRRYMYIYDQVDTADAAERIKNGIWFKGPNVWILAFAIVLASVGLNVNSTAVIIGAMLVSPLMGPIIGVGLAMGTNDTDLLKSAAKNLLVMVVISLLASTIFFLLSPLSLVNPTEIEARTSPTIYDVLIAFFGGLAGILENSRKERGTVLSGVAIATALMPPLCTAGYGLAHLNFHFFFGALYLFLINSVFISLATYMMVKYLRFRTVSGTDAQGLKKRRRIIFLMLTLIIVPSIWSAFKLVSDNNYERNVHSFIEDNRMVSEGSYIYDYKVKGRHTNITVGGDELSDIEKEAFLRKAESQNIKRSSITITEHSFGMSQKDMDELINAIYTRTDNELERNDEEVEQLKDRLDKLSLQLDSLTQMASELISERDSLLTSKPQVHSRP